MTARSDWRLARFVDGDYEAVAFEGLLVFEHDFFFHGGEVEGFGVDKTLALDDGGGLQTFEVVLFVRGVLVDYEEVVGGHGIFGACGCG